MNELPTSPEVQSLAILDLEARVKAAEMAIAALVAATPHAVTVLREVAEYVPDMGVASMLTDRQLEIVQGSLLQTAEAATEAITKRLALSAAPQAE